MFSSEGFNWKVASDGYKIVATKAYLLDGSRKVELLRGTGMTIDSVMPSPLQEPRQTFIVEATATTLPRYREYDAGDSNADGLFLSFARAAEDQDGILRFVRQYGLPEQPRDRVSLVSGDTMENWSGKPDLSKVRGHRAVPLDVVAADAHDMATVVGLWRALREEAVPSLEKLFEVVPAQSDCEHQVGERLVFAPGAVFGPFAATQAEWHHDYANLADMAESEGVPLLVKAALNLVEQTVNRRLKAETRAFLRPGRGVFGLDLALGPRSLSGLMWLQFADAFANNTEFRRCGSCWIWFAVAPGNGRSDKRFCSDSCRSKAHRRLKADVIEMATRHMRPDEIAARLDVAESTVRRWLASESEENVNGTTTRP